MAVSHLSLDLCLGNQGCNRVHDYNIQSAGAHHSLSDLQSLFSVIRLRNIKIVDIHTDIFCINRIKRMLRINKSRNSAAFLNLCNHMQGNGCFTTGFRSIDLNNTSLGHAAYSKGNIKPQRAGRNRLYLHMSPRFSQFHNRALSILFLNM